MTPKVSVISIFFNAEAYFREAIESVLAQDFEDFELLLVDDGAVDASPAIASEFARDPRVRVLEHPGRENRGMSATRNLGLRHAAGEYVAFIDADDRWQPSKLREQLDMFELFPAADAVCGSVNYWASHNGGKDRIVPTGGRSGIKEFGPGQATLKLYPLGKAHAPSMSDLMFTRESIVTVGGFEETFRGAYEDQAFLSKYYLRSTILVTDQVWSDYRIHEGSCMAAVQQQGSYEDVRRRFLEWFESYVASSQQRGDPEVLEALARALKPYRRKQTSLRDAARSVPLLLSAVRAGKSAARRLRPILAPGPAVLMYHRIADESFDPWGLAVSPTHFAEQMEWIARHRTPLPLAEFATLHREGKLPRYAIAVTFDDGYACNGEVAQPLLERLGIPATIFLPTELIEREQEFWWDELERIVMTPEGGTLRLDSHEVQLGDVESDESWRLGEEPHTSRQLAYRQLWKLLYAKTEEDLSNSICQLREQAGVAETPRDSHRPLTRGEVQAMQSDLIEFGSHALTHASLPALPADQKAREIRLSIERCNDLTGTEPRSFAYPYGDFDPESAKLVEEAGFLCACRADGWFVRRRTSPFELPRIFVGNSGADQLARQLGRP